MHVINLQGSHTCIGIECCFKAYLHHLMVVKLSCDASSLMAAGMCILAMVAMGASCDVSING